MVKELKKVYFRVEAGYVWGEGISLENRIIFAKEIRNIFLPLGFQIESPTISGASEEAVRGIERLYLHPQDFSGLLEESTIEDVRMAIGNSKIKLYMVDIFETFYDEGEDFLISHLNEMKEMLKNKLFNSFKTTRRNKFRKLNVSGLRIPINLVNEKLGNQVYVQYLQRLVEEMYQEGLLVRTDNAELPHYYRSLNATELKKWKSQRLKTAQ